MGIFLDDAQGRAVYVNNKCAELIGLSPEEGLDFDALDTLDSGRIASIIRRIDSSNHDLARTLERLTDSCDYPAILDVLDRIDSGSTPGDPMKPCCMTAEENPT